MSALVWESVPSGYDRLVIGRCHLIVWTGSAAKDLDDGHQVCSMFVPTNDTKFRPDGLVLISRRRLDAIDRAEGHEEALVIARAALADHASLGDLGTVDL